MFDYVVVGAGSAGCVVAARLSEDPDVRVALLEAGPPDTAMEIHVPAAFPRLFKTRWDWDSTASRSRVSGAVAHTCREAGCSVVPVR